MRDLLILALVLAGTVLALRRPQIGVLLWTWISLMNPHRFAWGFAYSAPIAAMSAGGTIIGLLLTSNRRSPFQGAPVWWMAIFAIWVTVSWQMGLDPRGDFPLWDRVMKIFFMMFVALSLLYTKKDIVAFAWVAVGSIAILGAKGGLFTIATGGGYRVFGPPESFIADNNDFALATVIAIPMLYFLFRQLTNKKAKYLVIGAMLLCTASVLGSQSRGGLLALLAMGAVFWWRNSNRMLIGAAMLIVMLMFLPMMPDAWWDRMETISSYQQDESAMGRINAWHVAWHTAKNYFFGGGMSYQYSTLFSKYGPYETIVRAAHSIYFQVLGNHGFVGLFLFLMIWISAFRVAGKLQKLAREIPQAAWAVDLGAMVQVSLWGYLVGGAFLSLQYFDFPYYLVVMIVLARKWVLREGWRTEPESIWAIGVIRNTEQGRNDARDRLGIGV